MLLLSNAYRRLPNLERYVVGFEDFSEKSQSILTSQAGVLKNRTRLAFLTKRNEIPRFVHCITYPAPIQFKSEETKGCLLGPLDSEFSIFRSDA